MCILLFSQSLIEAHDDVLLKTYKSPVLPVLATSSTEQTGASNDVVMRVIGLCKTSSEPLVSDSPYL